MAATGLSSLLRKLPLPVEVDLSFDPTYQVGKFGLHMQVAYSVLCNPFLDDIVSDASG